MAPLSLGFAFVLCIKCYTDTHNYINRWHSNCSNTFCCNTTAIGHGAELRLEPPSLSRQLPAVATSATSFAMSPAPVVVSFLWQTTGNAMWKNYRYIDSSQCCQIVTVLCEDKCWFFSAVVDKAVLKNCR